MELDATVESRNMETRFYCVKKHAGSLVVELSKWRKPVKGVIPVISQAFVKLWDVFLRWRTTSRQRWFRTFLEIVIEKPKYGTMGCPWLWRRLSVLLWVGFQLQVPEAGGHRCLLSQRPLSSSVQIQRMQFIGNKRMGSESSFAIDSQVGA